MSRSNPRRTHEETEQLAAVRRVRDLREHNARVRRDLLHGRFLKALATGGGPAHALWLAHRAELVEHGLLAPDVIITPSAWTPQPAPWPHPEPLPPTPTVLDAARVAAGLLAQCPPMTEEDHAALGVYLARLGLLYRELRWHGQE